MRSCWRHVGLLKLSSSTGYDGADVRRRCMGYHGCVQERLPKQSQSIVASTVTRGRFQKARGENSTKNGITDRGFMPEVDALKTPFRYYFIAWISVETNILDHAHVGSIGNMFERV